MNFPDLNTLKNNKYYDGNTEKFGITYNNKDFIVKFPKSAMDSSVFSEYVSSNFINNMRFSAHNTYLTKYEEETVVILEGFTTSAYKLRSSKDTDQSSEDTDISTKGYTYDDILYLIERHNKILKKTSQLLSKLFGICLFLMLYLETEIGTMVTGDIL